MVISAPIPSPFYALPAPARNVAAGTIIWAASLTLTFSIRPLPIQKRRNLKMWLRQVLMPFPFSGKMVTITGYSNGVSYEPYVLVMNVEVDESKTSEVLKTSEVFCFIWKILFLPRSLRRPRRRFWANTLPRTAARALMLKVYSLISILRKYPRQCFVMMPFALVILVESKITDGLIGDKFLLMRLVNS